MAAAADQFADQLRAFAQDPRTAPDKLFVLHAGKANLEEIECSRQAVNKATNPEVKRIAQRIIDDHTKAQQQLQPIAQQLGVTLPTALPEPMRQVSQIMESQPADVFEKHYVTNMQAEHGAAITWFRATPQLSQNDQIRQYA